MSIEGFCFNRIVEEDEKIWFVSMELIACLFQLNKLNGQIRCLGVLPINYMMGEQYSTIGKLGDRIIIAPYYCKGDFIEYDLQKGTFRKIPLEYNICSNYGTFTYAIKYESALFFIGNVNGVIVEVNNKYEYIYHFQWALEVQSQVKNKLFFSGCQCIKNNLYLSMFNTNKIVQLEMPVCRFKEVVVMPFEYKILSQFYDEINIWYIPIEGNRIIKWKVEEKIFEIINLPLNLNSKRALKNLIFLNDVYVVCNDSIRKDFLIHANGEVLEYICKSMDILKKSEMIQPCIYLANKKSTYLLCDNIFIEIKEQNIRKYKITIDYEYFNKVINFSDVNWKLGIKYEKNRRSLYNFIELCVKEDTSILIPNQNGSIIYKHLVENS